MAERVVPPLGFKIIISLLSLIISDFIAHRLPRSSSYHLCWREEEISDHTNGWLGKNTCSRACLSTHVNWPSQWGPKNKKILFEGHVNETSPYVGDLQRVWWVLFLCLQQAKYYMCSDLHNYYRYLLINFTHKSVSICNWFTSAFCIWWELYLCSPKLHWHLSN